VSGYDEWQLARAWVPLVRLCATLPEYVGCIDASKVAKMIDVDVPYDEISVEEAAKLVNRTPNRIRQLCRTGIGRYVSQERRWLVFRKKLLEHFKISGA
jgi:hypothetical protein